MLLKHGKRWRAGGLILAAVLFSLWMGTEAFAAQSGWVSQEDGWYYYLLDGRPGSGWIQDKGKYYYLLENGRCLTDTITPDGYYVDGDGAWYQRGTKILDVSFHAPDRFAPTDAEWVGKGALSFLKDTVKMVFGGKRRIDASENAIEYISGSSTTSGSQSGRSAQETVLIGLYKEPEQGGYRLDLRTRLDQGSSNIQEAATYDYAAFRAMIYQVSASPELLEDALYNAWQGDNRWQISRQGWTRVGDSMVIYTSGDGYGRFSIRPAQAESVPEQ